MSERTIRPRPGDLERATRPHDPVRSGEFVGVGGPELCDLCGLSVTNLTIHNGLPTRREGPDDGHTFRFTWCSRGSSKVVGDEHCKDAPQFNEDLAVTIEVRAWSLKAAIEKLGQLPFPVLMGHETEGNP